ncbi:MAG: hypothetical protein HYV68_03205 [Candidatus Taylorbacteria bacterium]|nr:hypothetical protein [Candidatus Taylorbacteria bacterium]
MSGQNTSSTVANILGLNDPRVVALRARAAVLEPELDPQGREVSLDPTSEAAQLREMVARVERSRYQARLNGIRV